MGCLYWIPSSLHWFPPVDSQDPSYKIITIPQWTSRLEETSYPSTRPSPLNWYSREASFNPCCAKFILKLIDHDDVIKCKHFPRYWPFVRGIHRSPVNSLHKGQWGGVLMFKQSWGWRFETPSRSLSRHCNVHGYGNGSLTHWAETKWLPISWWHIQMHFPEWRYITFD